MGGKHCVEQLKDTTTDGASAAGFASPSPRPLRPPPLLLFLRRPLSPPFPSLLLALPPLSPPPLPALYSEVVPFPSPSTSFSFLGCFDQESVLFCFLGRTLAVQAPRIELGVRAFKSSSVASEKLEEKANQTYGSEQIQVIPAPLNATIFVLSFLFLAQLLFSLCEWVLGVSTCSRVVNGSFLLRERAS